MRKLLIFLALLPFGLFAQQNDTPPRKETTIRFPSASRSVHAVIIGVSDYQSAALPDLQFAHRDALALAEWLSTTFVKNGGQANITTLVNEQATMGKVAMALTALLESAKEGDWVIIFFSGHGDVESKTMAQPGYWLCWDAPPTVYMSGGCLNLWNLQDIISTLSLRNKARVLVISDACRAGKLAGSEIGGPQATTANLSRQFANETKILSCQPNEFSLEGLQWGGGRGCFSYHLINGLYGLADRSLDNVVTLLELENYLEEHVPAETAPHRQIPFTVGNKAIELSRVDAQALAAIKAGNTTSGEPILEKIDPRGMSDWMLAGADSSITALYNAFNEALVRKELLSPPGACADDYYRRLMLEPSLEGMRGLITRNFAAALVDESQQVTNHILNTDPAILSDIQYRPFLFCHIPAYLARATELLGEQHFMYKTLKSKQHYFEGKCCLPENYPGISGDSLVNLALSHYKQSQQLDSTSAFVLTAYAALLAGRYGNTRDALDLLKKAHLIAPNWAYGNYMLGMYIYANNTDTAIYYLKRAIELDSTFLQPYWALGASLMFTGDYQRAEIYFQTFQNRTMALLASQPEEVPVSYLVDLCSLHISKGEYQDGEKLLLEALHSSKGQIGVLYSLLADLYTKQKRYEEALIAAKKAIDFAPDNPDVYFLVARVYIEQKKIPESVEELEKAFKVAQFDVEKLDWSGSWLMFELADGYISLGRPNEAKELYSKLYHKFENPADPVEMNFKARACFALEGDLASVNKIIEEGIKSFPNIAMVQYQAACVYSVCHQEALALQWLENAIRNGINDYALFMEDRDLANIRDSKGFKTLMKQYFPDK